MIPDLHVDPLVVNRPEGEATIWVPRPHLVLTRVEGRMTMDHAESIIHAVDGAIADRPGEVVAVHDWTAVKSYEVAVHAKMSAWGVRTIGFTRRVIIG